jgi:uncharacterized protein YneF (UPF0154 family)
MRGAEALLVFAIVLVATLLVGVFAGSFIS